MAKDKSTGADQNAIRRAAKQRQQQAKRAAASANKRDATRPFNFNDLAKDKQIRAANIARKTELLAELRRAGAIVLPLKSKDADLLAKAIKESGDKSLVFRTTDDQFMASVKKGIVSA